MNVKAGVVLLSALALVVAGCGSSKSKKTTSSTTATPAKTPAKVGAPGAKVSFSKPTDGSTVPAGPVVATVKLTNFTLDPKDFGKAAKQGFGHLHFKMDEGKYDFPKYSGPNGVLAKGLGVQGKYSPSVTPTITYKGLPAGKHKLEVYLANNDHTNAGPEAATSFTIK